MFAVYNCPFGFRVLDTIYYKLLIKTETFKIRIASSAWKKWVCLLTYGTNEFLLITKSSLDTEQKDETAITTGYTKDLNTRM